MLIPFPIALLALVPVTDIVYWAVADPFWARVSQYLLWAGLLSGALAALVGLVDFVGIKRVRTHRHGWLHLGANASVLAIAVVNIILRQGDVAGAILPSGLILSIVGLALLAVGGWYGGELSYRHKIGVIAEEGEHEDRGRERRREPGAAPAGG